MLTTLDLLNKARFEFARHKMAKGSYEKDDGSICAMGAVNIAIAQSGIEQPFRTLSAQTDYAQTYLNAAVPERFIRRYQKRTGRMPSIMAYNDDLKTRKRDIVKAFDRALILASKDALTDQTPPERHAYSPYTQEILEHAYLPAPHPPVTCGVDMQILVDA